MKTFKQFVAEKMTPKEKSKIRTMDPHTFDQTSKGWRETAHSGAADAHDKASIVAGVYDRVHSIRGTNKWKSTVPKGTKNIDPETVRFHAGQTAAFAGKNERALKHFDNVKSDSDHQFRKYTNATKAFIRGDKKEFNRNSRGPNYNNNILQSLRHGLKSGKSYKDSY